MSDTFPYASEDELKEGQKYYEEIVTKLPEPKKGFSKKNIIVDLIKQFKATPQFYRIQVPAVLVAPISMLEMMSRYYCPTPSILGIANAKSEVDRMLRVIKWALSNCIRKIHTDGIAHAKPYNPILGERSIWKWKHSDSETFCLAEQVCHHPPISAFYISNRKKNFSCRSTINPFSKLYPNSFEMKMAGEINLMDHLHEEEYFLQFPPLLYYGILFGKQFSEHNGVYEIKCPKTNLTFLMLFKEKQGNKVMGRLIRNHQEENEETIFKFNGKATQKILIKNVKTNKVSLFLNNQNSKFTKTKHHMLPLTEMNPLEGRRNWHMLTKSLIDGDLSNASKYKEGVENKQRELRKKRNDDKVEWEAKFFKLVKKETLKVRKFEEQKKEDTEIVPYYQCFLENRTPFKDGEKDEFENHPMFEKI